MEHKRFHLKANLLPLHLGETRPWTPPSLLLDELCNMSTELWADHRISISSFSKASCPRYYLLTLSLVPESPSTWSLWSALHSHCLGDINTWSGGVKGIGYISSCFSVCTLLCSLLNLLKDKLDLSNSFFGSGMLRSLGLLYRPCAPTLVWNNNTRRENVNRITLF